MDEGVAARVAWLTPRRVTLFTMAWLVAFALGSIAVSNPFASEPNAGATPDYWRVMYLHGLLIGVVGLAALLLLDVFTLRGRHVRVGIAAGVVAATVLAGLGGIWDTKVPGAEVALWTQITAFVVLDEILVMLIVGFWQGWQARAASSRSLPYLCAGLGAASMLVAALMGHVAGWMLEFGDHPGHVFSDYAKFAGEDFHALRDNLITSHSHEMAVAAMVLVLAAAAHGLGYERAGGAARSVARVGMAMVAFGAVAMTAVYVAAAVSDWTIPTLFKSAGGSNGVAGDDLITGVFVMGGGLIALWPVVLRGLRAARSWVGAALPLAAAWAWTGVVGGVVIAGYWIELHETFFGAGDQKAAGAPKDAVFTWLHQDVALFLFPALVVVLLLADRLVTRHYRDVVGWSALAGTTVLLIGGGIWVFVNPALHGPGYVISTIGLVLVGISIAITIFAGLAGDRRLRLVPQRLVRAEAASTGPDAGDEQSASPEGVA